MIQLEHPSPTPEGTLNHVKMGSIYEQWTPPADLKPSIFKPLCHPSYPKIAQETDAFFLKHWNFANDKSRKKFIAADYSRFACLNYPLSLNDRIGFACRIITLLFLTDGESLAVRLEC